ncbi:MAG: putative signal transducing protein [Blastocatellia bacterium]
MRDEGFVTIAYFANSAEAGMACELLANNGVNATLTGANFGGLEPLPMPGGFSEIRLVVPADEAERARELYDAFFAVDEEAPNKEAENE